MKSLTSMLLLLLASAALVGARDESRPNSLWERSVVTLEVSRKQYDYYQPWGKPVRQVLKTGTVISDRQILTTADELNDRTLVRVQKGGRGRWWLGEVTWLDYYANLALITISEREFWADVKPVTLARSASSEHRFQILRWRDGNLESRGAEFSQFTVPQDPATGVSHVILEVASEIQAAGHGEPVLAGARLTGMVQAQEGRTCNVIPASFIQQILDAQKLGRYPGLGFFHFVWQHAENPASLALLKLEGRPRGVLVIDVPNRPDGFDQILKPRDIILQIDGFDIDTDGDYNDSEFGHLMLENLSTRRKFAGADVAMQIWRDGHLMHVTYRLPKFEYTTLLVPYAIYDQEPEYLIVGGLVFQRLTDSFLQSWGAEWKTQAPFRLNYYNNESPTGERPSIIFLAQVLPDTYNIGYQGQNGLVVNKVNGRRITRLNDLRAALDQPANGFNVIEFARGETLQHMVLEAGDAERQATDRVLQRYGIPTSFHFQTNSTTTLKVTAATKP